MSEIAKLKIGDNSYEFPLIEGSENELAIDIKTLRGVSNGVITIDPGYKNTGACKSAITFLNGEKGVLRYRGYSIEDLAEKADFLEVSYLLIFGELPSQDQLSKFHLDIKDNAIVDDDVRNAHETDCRKSSRADPLQTSSYSPRLPFHAPGMPPGAV